jgi:cytochrome c-type biogenesis protein CcsB
MKKVIPFISSMLFTGILLTIFALAVAYATFIENDFGTQTAKVLVYNAWWFELLLVVLAINLIGSTFKYKMVALKKWPMLLFHFAFVIIVIGAGVTRYYGYEGMMHIREGEKSNSIVSTETYVTVTAKMGNTEVSTEKVVKFSPYTNNPYSEKLKINGQTLRIKNLQYMPSAKETPVADANGVPVVSMVAVTGQMQPQTFALKHLDKKTLNNNMVIGFNSGPDADVLLTVDNNILNLVARDSLIVTDGQTNEKTTIPPNEKINVDQQKVYSVGKLIFAVRNFIPSARIDLTYSAPQNGNTLPDAIKTQVTLGDESTELVVFGRNGMVGQPAITTLYGVEVAVSYGAKQIELPFALYLEDFQLERYPGSNSPSSFASEVVLLDDNTETPYRIFMNNILKHKGYRFFQSSYDTDEKGTVLSVNYDSLGTGITYFGYFLMGLGMVLGLFNRNSRFASLLKTSGKIRNERKKYLATVLIILGTVFGAQAADSPAQKEHLSQFEKLVVQNSKGRLEPVNTIASQILRKVAKKTSWEGMSPTEVFIDMQAHPEKWKTIPIIKIANSQLRNQLGIFNGKYASFNQLVASPENGGYKLQQMVQEAYEKKSNERNKYDKEVIYVDERVNIFMNVINGNFLTILPIPDSPENEWVSVAEINKLPPNIQPQIEGLTGNYFSALAQNNWNEANRALKAIVANQQQHGNEIIPKDTKIQLEVFYNKANIFGKLSKVFMFSGLILLFIQLIGLFQPKYNLAWVNKVAIVFIGLLFLIESAGLGIRWYISGHAPWSNGYESMIFISWATCLGGLLFAKRSHITLSLTAVLAGLTLMVAGMSWMSPEITPLVPVLKSYWLIVHVAIITASYGFLGISALLGFINLLLMIFYSPHNYKRLELTVRELVNTIQVALIIGLLLLTLGSFLGGVWANESWGRYWGWDPKESWALITILVYTFITHMHRIPGLNNNFALSTGALIGIGSVLMTYFGVNYYLSGLHSYAQGDAPPIPFGVYIAIGVVGLVILLAYFSNNKMKVAKKK